MKELKRFSALEEVVEFFKKMQEEFTLTNFTPVISVLSNIPAYSYEVDINFCSENSVDAISEQKLMIRKYTPNWNEATTIVSYRYKTSSDHAVEINTDKETGEFVLSIGKDQSRNFYAIVMGIVGI